MSVNSAQGRIAGTVALTTTVAIGAILMVFPFYWLIVAASHPTNEIFSSPPPLLPSDYLFTNISNLFQDTSFGRAMINSVVAAVVYTLLSGAICTFAGYAFAKYEFRGKTAMFGLVLAVLAVPVNLTIIPMFQIATAAHLLSSLPGLLLPNLALPFGIFLMRQTLQSVPDELLQAGRVDGLGEFGIMFRIVLPSMPSALAALAVYLFMTSWNDFLWPLVVLRAEDSYTVPLAIASLQGLINTDHGQILAATLLSVLPVAGLFLILQRQFVAGILAGAVKQ